MQTFYLFFLKKYKKNRKYRYAINKIKYTENFKKDNFMKKELEYLSKLLKKLGFNHEAIRVNGLYKKAMIQNLLPMLFLAGCSSEENSLTRGKTHFFWGAEREESNTWLIYNSAMPLKWEDVQSCYSSDTSAGFYDPYKFEKYVAEQYEKGSISKNDMEQVIGCIENPSGFSNEILELTDRLSKESGCYISIYTKLIWDSNIIFKNFKDSDQKLYIQKNISEPLGYKDGMTYERVLAECENPESDCFKRWDGTPFRKECVVKLEYSLTDEIMYAVPFSKERFCSDPIECLGDVDMKNIFPKESVSDIMM